MTFIHGTTSEEKAEIIGALPSMAVEGVEEWWDEYGRLRTLGCEEEAAEHLTKPWGYFAFDLALGKRASTWSAARQPPGNTLEDLDR